MLVIYITSTVVRIIEDNIDVGTDGIFICKQTKLYGVDTYSTVIVNAFSLPYDFLIIFSFF